MISFKTGQYKEHLFDKYLIEQGLKLYPVKLYLSDKPYKYTITLTVVTCGKVTCELKFNSPLNYKVDAEHLSNSDKLDLIESAALHALRQTGNDFATRTYKIYMNQCFFSARIKGKYYYG